MINVEVGAREIPPPFACISVGAFCNPAVLDYCSYYPVVITGDHGGL